MRDFFDFERLFLVDPVLVKLVLHVGDALADAGWENLLGLGWEIGLYLLALFDDCLLELVFVFGVGERFAYFFHLQF